jgi:hypothetical protein
MSLSQRKMKLLNYNELLRLTFEDLNKRIANKNYVIEVTDFLNDTMKNINSLYRFNIKTTKIFLLSFVILFHTDIINDRKDDFAKKMSLYSSNLVYSFEEIYKKKLSIKTYKTFKENLDKYFIFFEKWKERDALILIRPMLQTCFTIDTYIEQLEKKEENKEKEILSLKNNLSKIIKNIKVIGGEKALEFYKSKKLPVFIDEKIFTDTEKVVRRAFWDVFEENIKEKNHKQVPELLKDIKKIIKDIVKDKTFINDLDININIEYISSIISTDQFIIDNIKKYMYYLISKLEKIQQPSEDKNTKIFLENINNMIEKEEKMGNILRYFFENYFQKLEKIKYITLYIKKKIKIETI